MCPEPPGAAQPALLDLGSCLPGWALGGKTHLDVGNQKRGAPRSSSHRESIQPRGARACKECCYGERGVLKGCLEQSAWNLEEENLETVTGEEVGKCGHERYLAFHSCWVSIPRDVIWIRAGQTSAIQDQTVSIFSLGGYTICHDYSALLAPWDQL